MVRPFFHIPIPSGLCISLQQQHLPSRFIYLTGSIRMEQFKIIGSRILVVENKLAIGLLVQLIVMPYLVRVCAGFIVILGNRIGRPVLEVYSSALGLVSFLNTGAIHLIYYSYFVEVRLPSSFRVCFVSLAPEAVKKLLHAGYISICNLVIDKLLFHWVGDRIKRVKIFLQRIAA